jgi:predicted small secreted protein
VLRRAVPANPIDEESPMKSTLFRGMFLLALTVCTLGLSACNTMHGAGKDIERGGEKMQGASEGAQRN